MIGNKTTDSRRSLTVFSFPYKLILGGDCVEELYKMAIESVKRYREAGGELIDFDDFMDEIEKEYGIQKGQK